MDTDEPPFARMPRVVGGRYGLSSKELTPSMVKPIFDELGAQRPKRHFTVGIFDDVTHLSLADRRRSSAPAGPPARSQAVFFGLGSDGTVGANKSSVKIIGESTDLLRAGLLRLRLQEVGLGHRVAPALRPRTDPLDVPHRRRRLRRLPPVRPARDDQGARATPGPGATLLLNSPFAARPRCGTSCRARCSSSSIDKRHRLLGDRRRHGRPRGRHGRPHQHDHAAVLLPALRRAAAPTRPSRASRRRSSTTYGRRGRAVVERNFAAIDRALARPRPRRGAGRRVDERPHDGRDAFPTDAPDFVQQGHRLAPGRRRRPAAGERAPGRRHVPHRHRAVREAGHRQGDPDLGSRTSASTAASARSCARTPRSA